MTEGRSRSRGIPLSGFQFEPSLYFSFLAHHPLAGYEHCSRDRHAMAHVLRPLPTLLRIAEPTPPRPVTPDHTFLIVTATTPGAACLRTAILVSCFGLVLHQWRGLPISEGHSSGTRHSPITRPKSQPLPTSHRGPLHTPASRWRNLLTPVDSSRQTRFGSHNHSFSLTTHGGPPRLPLFQTLVLSHAKASDVVPNMDLPD
jgi:hypothetical protein